MNDKELHWQLISQLIESCLLENWINPKLVQKTTIQHYRQTLDIQTTIKKLSPSEQTYFIDLDNLESKDLLVLTVKDNEKLLLIVEPAYCSPWRLIKPYFPLLQVQTDNGHQLQVITNESELLQIMLSVFDLSNSNVNSEIPKTLSDEGVEKLKNNLQLAYTQALWSNQTTLVDVVYNQPHWYQTLIASEQWASLVDRPFHPLAKCKIGLSYKDYQYYMAEFNQPVVLTWYAVAKTHLMVATDIDVESIQADDSAQYLLNDDELKTLNDELFSRGIKNSHVAIPTHPWQVTEEIAKNFSEDLENGTVVKLDFNQAETWASSSIRSMLLKCDTPHSIKLPLGVYALNSKRYLPALKLINGEKNQDILKHALQLDSKLKNTLHLWDERHWWGYMFSENTLDRSSTNPGFYNEKPTHLGAMLRTLPKQLCQDDTRLLTMASLGVIKIDHLRNQEGLNSQHIFDEVIASRDQDINQETVLNCFTQLSNVFFETMLRCIRLGFVPEMHGQNVVIVLKNHQFTGVLLRDHDSVRIYLPWLISHDIADPNYLSPPDVQNRLYRQSPQELIFYLQSLGILVNIRAIVEALSEHYRIAETLLWQQVRQSIRASLFAIDFTDEQRQVLKESLLESKMYPHKTLLLPVIERGSNPHGSMPAGESITNNPLYH